MQYSTKKLAEHKLIILHLLQKMGISLSNSEICQFLLEKNYMDYFSVQQYLAELESAGWLEKTREQNNTRYTLTDDGEEVINYFINRISDEVKNEINVYVHENSRRIRAEYAVTANYFPELNGDYLVKCSLWCILDLAGKELQCYIFTGCSSLFCAFFCSLLRTFCSFCFCTLFPSC